MKDDNLLRIALAIEKLNDNMTANRQVLEGMRENLASDAASNTSGLANEVTDPCDNKLATDRLEQLETYHDVRLECARLLYPVPEEQRTRNAIAEPQAEFVRQRIACLLRTPSACG